MYVCNTSNIMHSRSLEKMCIHPSLNKYVSNAHCAGYDIGSVVQECLVCSPSKSLCGTRKKFKYNTVRIVQGLETRQEGKVGSWGGSLPLLRVKHP